MANSFNKEERVAFESILEGFQDALVLSRNVGVYNTDQTMMERASDTIWRPQPYIASSIDAAPGTDISASYKDSTQLAVPSTIGFSKSVPFTLDAKELRDALRKIAWLTLLSRSWHLTSTSLLWMLLLLRVL